MTTIHIEQQELLDFIIEHPDDDAARLVYADWLEEHDQAERAEIIRGQIRYNNCYPLVIKAFDYPNTAYFSTDSGFEEYIQRKPDHPVALCTKGFVEKLACPLEFWRTNGSAIVGEHPLQRLKITDKDPAERYPGLEWCWFPDENWELINRPAIIPLELKDYMIGKPYRSYNEDDPDPFAFDYSSSESAHADLSQAIIKQAKIARKCQALIDQSHTDVVAANDWLVNQK